MNSHTAYHICVIWGIFLLCWDKCFADSIYTAQYINYAPNPNFNTLLENADALQRRHTLHNFKKQLDLSNSNTRTSEMNNILFISISSGHVLATRTVAYQP